MKEHEHKDCGCVLCRFGKDKALAMIRSSIDANGFAMIGAPSENDLPYAYTVGRAEKGLAEYICGLTSPDINEIVLLNMVDDQSTTKGPLAIWLSEEHSHANVPLVIVEMDSRFISRYCPFVMALADKPAEEIRCRMVFFPDTSRRWPWDDGYDLPLAMEFSDEFYKAVLDSLESQGLYANGVVGYSVKH